jgi:hypothetical protein
VVTNEEVILQRAKCHVDCCGFYWTGRNGDVVPFIASGARASELEGAMMNAQLDRLPAILAKLRKQKKRLAREVIKIGLTPSPSPSLDWECGSMLMCLLDSAEQAQKFAKLLPCGIAGRTGRHTSNEWEPILKQHGAMHPALDPFKLGANRTCRKKYTPDVWEKSLGILNRTIQIWVDPKRTEKQVAELVRKIEKAARECGCV